MSLFHKHNWKIVDSQPVKVMGDDWLAPADTIVGYKTYVALRCQSCGDVKNKTINGAFPYLMESNGN